jgi:hypothetical protein
LENLGNIPCVLDTSQFNITLALLDGITNKFGRAGFTLGSDDSSLLLLTGLVDEEGGSLSVLLCDLFSFDGGGELGRECKMLGFHR